MTQAVPAAKIAACSIDGLARLTGPDQQERVHDGCPSRRRNGSGGREQRAVQPGSGGGVRGRMLPTEFPSTRARTRPPGPRRPTSSQEWSRPRCPSGRGSSAPPLDQEREEREHAQQEEDAGNHAGRERLPDDFPGGEACDEHERQHVLAAAPAECAQSGNRCDQKRGEKADPGDAGPSKTSPARS